MSGHRLIEVELYALKSELHRNEYFESCETVQDFEIALEQLYETLEEARDVLVGPGDGVVKLRAVIEEVRDGPNDFEL